MILSFIPIGFVLCFKKSNNNNLFWIFHFLSKFNSLRVWEGEYVPENSCTLLVSSVGWPHVETYRCVGNQRIESDCLFIFRWQMPLRWAFPFRWFDFNRLSEIGIWIFLLCKQGDWCTKMLNDLVVRRPSFTSNESNRLTLGDWIIFD